MLFNYKQKRKNIPKYSLNSYLDIIGEYADTVIKNSKRQEHLQYLGGECMALYKDKEEMYLFKIKLFFRNEEGEYLVKEAERNLQRTSFTDETMIELNSCTIFEVTDPDI